MKKTVIIIAALAITVLLVMLTPFIGGTALDLGAVLGNADSTDAQIFFEFRLPRVILALIAGASLAACGMTFQALFRNDLATPYTLGVAGGASFAIVLYIFIGGPIIFLPLLSGPAVAALLGAFIAQAVVFAFMKMKQNMAMYEILLVGVALNFFFSSLTMLLQFKAEINQLSQMVHWMIGGLQIIGFNSIISIAPMVLVGLIIITLHLKELDLLLLGEDMAKTKGVDIPKVRKKLFIAVTLLTGSIVSICGPIAFVGLVAPHICRKIIGPSHKFLYPLSLIFGGAFLIGCDTIARTLFYPSDLPAGILTALLGGPFFMWIIIRKKRFA